MDNQYDTLLYQTDVRWISRERVVTQVFELLYVIKLFLKEKQSDLAAHFSDTTWLARLCYLADIFTELNKENLKFRGRNATKLDARQSVGAFLGKLKLEAEGGNRNGGAILHSVPFFGRERC